MPQNPELSVVAPVYNEEEGIEQVVRYWNDIIRQNQIQAEIVLANDGSTDRTLEILQKLSNEIPFLKPVSYTPNRGYGYALRTAIQASTGRWLITLDSDGQFDLADYVSLKKLQTEMDLDFVTGFRMKKKDNPFRVVADRSLNLIVRTLFSVKLRDTNCAMKLIRGDLARSLNIEARGYPTPTEITIKLLTLGAKTGEIGVRHSERLQGQSKLKFIQTSLSFFRFLFYLRKKVRLYRAGILQSL
ncbi:MAG TPA: glycosyltransferase family 2 protein [Acidobacteriota bacterium]|nr:glycosyltransferase family 2 protein [Acidobacteriota bacterium]